MPKLRAPKETLLAKLLSRSGRTAAPRKGQVSVENDTIATGGKPATFKSIEVDQAFISAPTKASSGDMSALPTM